MTPLTLRFRVTEGKLASFNKITVVGNDKTNDHVIFRELRTKPGELYSKDQVVRTVRELGQLGFFDAEQISPDFKNVDPNAGTVDIEFGLQEAVLRKLNYKEVTEAVVSLEPLDYRFNNFSMRNIFDKASYRPVPSGDGQKLSLRLQASQFFNTYALLSEPWLGDNRFNSQPHSQKRTSSAMISSQVEPINRSPSKSAVFPLV